ncbi:MAG: IPT/TIG domain-containing protein [Bryobacteraceae bacterium]|nr:IPT/TIG domain-containing protein [Bryobacteraceae bacterium]
MSMRIIGILCALCTCFSGVASAITVTFSLDTTMLVEDLADQPFSLEFYLLNGDLLAANQTGGPRTNPSNIVTISNFTYGGGFGFDPATDPAFLVFGGASGDIRSSVTLKANHLDNYFSQGFQPGSRLGFTIDFTHNVAVSDIHDIFHFGILDSEYANIPTFFGEIFYSILEINFDSDDPTVTISRTDSSLPTSAGQFLDLPFPDVEYVEETVVPEPGTFGVAAAAFLLLAFRKRIRTMRLKTLPVTSVFALMLLASFGSAGLMAAPAKQSPEYFTGKYQGRDVTFQVINGLAIVGGDMVIGEATIEETPDGVRTAFLTVPETPGSTQSTKRSSEKHANSVTIPTRLWPKVGGVVTVPYITTKGSATMTTAINDFNNQFAGKFRWVPRTNQRAYVDINLDGQSSNSCYATLGYTGGRSILQGVNGGCAVFAMLHEMAHVLGLAHEQARADRSRYIAVDFSNIAAASRNAYEQDFANNMDLGLYDYGSLMHYAPRGFGRNENPDMESIPVGIPFGDPPIFSAGDLDALDRLYFSAPTAVTVTSLPAGLPIIVDGMTYLAPRTFNWALNSTHTLNVPSGIQTIDGSNYLFGRWNSDLNGDLNPNRTITVTPGSGTLGSPSSAPRFTVYAVNYVKLAEYQAVPVLNNFISDVSNAGSVSPNPAPVSYPGLPGLYYIDRQLVTLTATPAAGRSFYRFEAPNTPVQTFGPAKNPITLPSDVISPSFFANFTSQPEVLLTTNILDNNASGIRVIYDNSDSKSLPAAWSAPYDSGWNSGTTHTVVVNSPVSPGNDPATRYVFARWTDNVTSLSRSVTVPNSGRLTLGANYNTFYKVTANVNTACGGRVTTSPSLPRDQFVASGTQLRFTAIPTSPFVFASWSGNVSSTANPLTLVETAEVIATANFNVINAPLAVTSLTPSSLPAGSPGQTITVSGTGFTPATAFFLGDFALDVTYVNSNTLTVEVFASDLTAPGPQTTIVENTQGNCSVFAFGPSLLVTP